MSEYLQVVFDVVTREFSYRHTWRDRSAAKVLKPPTMVEMPASVLCSQQESGRDLYRDAVNIAQPACSPDIVTYLSQTPDVSRA